MAPHPFIAPSPALASSSALPASVVPLPSSSAFVSALPTSVVSFPSCSAVPFSLPPLSTSLLLLLVSTSGVFYPLVSVATASRGDRTLIKEDAVELVPRVLQLDVHSPKGFWCVVLDYRPFDLE